MNYRIAIIDDSTRVIQSLVSDLNTFPQFEIVFTANNGQQYLGQLKNMPRESHPQVVLMDIEMPVLNGIEAVKQGCYLYPHIKHIMLTVVDDDVKLFDAIHAGADGYLLKDESSKTIADAIVEVIEKLGVPMSPRIARKTLKLLTQPPGDKKTPVNPATALSEREVQILKGMVDGYDYRRIADTLFISPNTVRNHISSIYDKLHISSKAQAVSLAIKNNWV